MATEDRVKVLEGEFKLIKSELRQTLGSVRDFLLDLKLPPMQEEPGTIKESVSGTEPGAETSQQPEAANPDEGFGGNDANDGFGDSGSSQPQNGMPDFSNLGQGAEDPASATAGQPQEEPQTEALPPLDFDDEEEDSVSSGDMPGQAGNKDETEDEEELQDGEEASEDAENGLTNPNQCKTYQAATPQVNMLANIIRWVSSAKKEIGSTQLPVFLDVYATTGSLSEEMRGIILHLAEVATNPSLSDETPENGQVISEQLKLCMEINRCSGQLPDEIKLKIQRLTELLLQQSMYYNKADVWSKLLMDLHGILTGGGSTLRSLQSIDPSILKRTPFEEPVDEAENEEEPTDDLTSGDDFTAADEDDNTFFRKQTREDSNMLKGTRPARLRLIMPVGEGQEQELDLGNLFIATDSKIKSVNTYKKSNILRK